MKVAVLLFLLFIAMRADVVRVAFEGNHAFDERELYESIGLYKPYAIEFWKKEPVVESATSAVLCAMMEGYYRARGFYHASVGSQLREGTLLLSIREGESVTVADVSVSSPLDLRAQIKLKSGDRFDADNFSQSKSAVKKRYEERGYCNAKHNAKAWVDIEKNEAYLLFESQPEQLCYFGSIEIEPAKNIDAWIIESYLGFKEGERYAPERIRRSYSELYAQEGISNALINVRDRNGEQVNVKVSVKAHEKPIRFKTGLGASSDEGVLLMAALKHRNIFGNLKTAGVEARYSAVRESLKGSFAMPLEGRNLVGTEAGYGNERFDGYRERSFYDKLYLQQLRNLHSFEESVRFERLNTYESSDPELFPQERYFITSLGAEWKYDCRDRLLDPTHGYYINPRLSGSYRSELSDTSYLKGLISAAYLFEVPGAVVGSRIRLGHVSIKEGLLPTSYRFYAGGMNSNRAYTYRQLGPKNSKGDPSGFDTLMEATLEYRMALPRDFKVVFFNDFTRIADGYLNVQRQNYVAAGIGLRYVTPIGPIALDAGMDVEESSQYAFHFHIGELF